MATQQCVATLMLFGFIVNALGFDGTTENHSYLKQLLSISLIEAFSELFADNGGEDGKGIGASPALPPTFVPTKIQTGRSTVEIGGGNGASDSKWPHYFFLEAACHTVLRNTETMLGWVGWTF